MPYGYNTAAPNPTTKNTINSVTLGTYSGYDLRDFLLNKNIGVGNGVFYPQIFTGINGSPQVGQPVLNTSINNDTNVIPNGLPLEIEGILHMQVAVVSNQFKNMDSTANDLTDIQYILPTQSPWPNSEFPNGIQPYPTSSSQDVLKYGIMGKTQEANYRNLTLKNRYLDVDSEIDMGALISQNTSPATQQNRGYLDTYGGLTAGGNISILASEIIGALNPTKDTNLGIIGGQQLAKAVEYNAAFDIAKSLLGSLNIQNNVLSLIKGDGLAGFRPNYQITVPSSSLGKVADYTARILGVTLPKSYLEDAGSILLSESNTGNIERANSMILHTGSGQVTALIANMNANINGTTKFDNPDTTPFRSGYTPGFKDNKGNKAINPSTYAFGDSDGIIYNFLTQNSAIPEINYNHSNMIIKYGFGGPEDELTDGNPYTNSTIKKKTFNWGSDVGGTVNSENSPFGGNVNTIFIPSTKKKGLLGKTQALFNDIGMKNIVSGFGDINSSIVPSQIQTAVVGGGISKGNAVMSAGKFDDNGRYNGQLSLPANTYARSWGSNLRYTNVSNLIRNRGLDGNSLNDFSTTVPYRNEMQGSILDTNGFPKIAPYSTDSPEDPKKFMFSIENLAWCDYLQNLLDEEKGPGDLLNGKIGRIMWFPPYDIKFTEGSAVSWESNNFIGRGEPVYTYNNTERSGTLSFKIVVDHPTYINSFRGNNGPDDHYVASFFAGAVLPSSKFANKLTVSEISSLSSDSTVPQSQTDTPLAVPPSFIVYFADKEVDIASQDNTYEDGLCNGIPIDYSIDLDGSGCITSHFPTNYGFNGGTNNTSNTKGIAEGKTLSFDNQSFSGWSDTNLLTGLRDFLAKDDLIENCVVHIQGFSNSLEPVGNEAPERALNMEAYIKLRIPGINTQITPGIIINEIGCKVSQDNLHCKSTRAVWLIFEYVPKARIIPQPVIAQTSKTISTQITNRFYTESNYFDKLKENDDFIFDKFRDKIKYFHPAFHSTTPEGLNSRLTFLNQCTRQGPTLETQGANNLAFGRAPVCILRIGDFYNTKIIIDNVGFDFEPLVWDLNPEGVGVQPMIANVTMSFKFIGGSTLMGPINKLQNALSFNYFANSQVYDVRADYLAKNSSDPNTQTDGKGNTIFDYELKNHFKDEGLSCDFKEANISTKEQIVAQTPILDQTKANNALNNQEMITPTPAITAVTITGVSYDKSQSLKSKTEWALWVNLTIENGTGDWVADATTLSTKNYSLVIYVPINGIGGDRYELKLDDITLLTQLINPTNVSKYFRVPIGTRSNGYTGIQDVFVARAGDVLNKHMILAITNADKIGGSTNIQVLPITIQ